MNKSTQTDPMRVMGIYWDIENVNVPNKKSTYSLVNRIKEKFISNYAVENFVAVCDVLKEKN